MSVKRTLVIGTALAAGLGPIAYPWSSRRQPHDNGPGHSSFPGVSFVSSGRAQAR